MIYKNHYGSQTCRASRRFKISNKCLQCLELSYDRTCLLS